MSISEILFDRFIVNECTASVVDSEALTTFLRVNEEKGRFLCVVTSGGSRVTLEKRVVRCLENFSTGLRGARMIESILDDDVNLPQYAVISLIRRGAVMPYARHYSVTRFADVLTFHHCCDGVQLTSDDAKNACQRLHTNIVEKRLLVIEYDTVQEYLLALKTIASSSVIFKRRVMFCLAAAVSDYFVPVKDMADHKLGSDSDELTLRLRKVPKCLGLLTTKWAPMAFVVSFKVRGILQCMQAIESCQ